MMKVLHIWNTAGIGSIIGKWEKKLLGWETNVFMYRAYDPYGLTTFGELWGSKKKKYNEKIVFFLKALIKSKHYDIIHVHYHDVFLPSLRILELDKKLIIMHYHGSDIRSKWKIKRRYWKHADIIFVSTKDLLVNAPTKAFYLPNPVDTDIFKPIPNLRRKGTALFFYDDSEKLRNSLKWAVRVARELGLNLTIINRKKNPIPYHRMPTFLNRFEYFIDHNYVPALSKTALEALACGLKVIRWDNKIIKELPYYHTPEYTVKFIQTVIKKLRK